MKFARIIPFELNGRTLPKDVWDVLWLFWGDKVAKWQEALGVQFNDPRITTEKVSNMLTLSPNMHGPWEDSWCAFRPISINNEKTSMEIKVHWIAIDKKADQLGNNTDEIELLQAPRPFLDEDFLRKRDSRIDGLCQWHVEKRRPLEDGEVITVTTDDPVKRPLPSMELLELQWILTRIAAMQGQV